MTSIVISASRSEMYKTLWANREERTLQIKERVRELYDNNFQFQRRMGQAAPLVGLLTGGAVASVCVFTIPLDLIPVGFLSYIGAMFGMCAGVAVVPPLSRYTAVEMTYLREKKQLQISDMVLTVLRQEPQFKPYFCSISKTLPTNPVRLGDNYYEWPFLYKWLVTHTTDPKTGESATLEQVKNAPELIGKIATLAGDLLYVDSEALKESNPELSAELMKFRNGLCETRNEKYKIARAAIENSQITQEEKGVCLEELLAIYYPKNEGEQANTVTEIE